MPAQKVLIVCDRGTLDNKAYMNDEEYNRHMNEFLEAYYGAGWTFVREYIDITSRLAKNGGYKLDGNENPTNAVCGQGIYDHPLTVITRQEYLNYELQSFTCIPTQPRLLHLLQKQKPLALFGRKDNPTYRQAPISL